MFYLGFFVGWVIGIFSAVLLVYLVRRETEQVADGERVCTNGKEFYHDDPFYVEVATGKYYFCSDLIKEHGRKWLCEQLAKGTFLNEGFYEKIYKEKTE